MSRVSRIVRLVLPFVVSGTILAVLLAKVDARSVVEHISVRAATVFLPVLLLFGFGSLMIEGLSLVRLIPAGRETPGWRVFAQIKAATYPLVLVHYALGAATLALLVGRRAGIKMATAAGVVMLITILDLGLLFVLAATSLALFATGAPTFRVGIVVAASLGIVGGLAALRMPALPRPLQRLQRLKVFRPARTTPAGVLAQLVVLRLLFVAGFVLVVWAALVAFEVRVPVANLVVNVVAITLVTALPIAVAGLGTGQLAFVYLFRHWAEPDTLLACSLTLSAGLIVMRASMGLFFAGELTREALFAARKTD